MGSVSVFLLLLSITAVISLPASDGVRFKRDSPSLPEPGICGVSLADRIVGGRKTAINAYPWAAILMAQDEDGGEASPFCGASLISDRFVLTAAHCFPEPGDDFAITKVRLGEWDILSENDCDDDESCSDDPIDAPIESFKLHEDYISGPDIYNDVALVKLADQITFTEYISPVCLPMTEMLQKKSENKRQFTAVGWGDIKFNAENRDVAIGNRYKFEVNLPGVSLETCRDAYPNLRDTEMCAGKTGKDTCQGDSGGPLSIAESDGYWYQHGVVSYGFGCGFRGYPGVYTRVTKFIPWIKETMKELSEASAAPSSNDTSTNNVKYTIYILNNTFVD